MFLCKGSQSSAPSWTAAPLPSGVCGPDFLLTLKSFLRLRTLSGASFASPVHKGSQSNFLLLFPLFPLSPHLPLTSTPVCGETLEGTRLRQEKGKLSSQGQAHSWVETWISLTPQSGTSMGVSRLPVLPAGTGRGRAC